MWSTKSRWPKRSRSGASPAAGVDVFPHEPCIDSPLFGLPNVVLTPHTGGSSEEALPAVGEMISTSVIAALGGQAVPNAVNLPPASLVAPELQRLTDCRLRRRASARRCCNRSGRGILE